MAYDFDTIIDRRCSDSEKWRCYGPEVLPLWVADMDFAAPEPVLHALRERIDHGVLGYGVDSIRLREVFVERLWNRYGWRVTPEDLVMMPGIISGFNVACRAIASPGEGVLIQSPVYTPILRAAANSRLARQEMELTLGPDGRYTVDYQAFEGAMSGSTRLFLLCSPHNPVGRVFERAELERMAEICDRHDVVICSDEIHCDLLLSGHRHIPVASLAPEIAARTITLMAPSKTYNIAGLHASIAVITDPGLRSKFRAARRDLVPSIDILGLVAAIAAYSEGEPWLHACLRYLEANLDYLEGFVAQRLPGVTFYRPEGTYLAWLDCRRAKIPGNPHEFFLREASVALNDGSAFGRGGEGFVRLNFACPRSLLAEGLERMERALAR